MSEFTRPATWDDVKRLALYFDEAGVEYAIIGGYALAAHGLARYFAEAGASNMPSSVAMPSPRTASRASPKTSMFWSILP